jgi:single-strand DNA-binding protein
MQGGPSSVKWNWRAVCLERRQARFGGGPTEKDWQQHLAGGLPDIIGNLGSDPIMRYTTDGTAVASFSLAVNERNRRAQGAESAQSEETTTWFRVTAWRRQAEIANDLLKKGMAVFVSGDLHTREFTGNDGQKRFSLDVTMDEMQILTPKGALDERPAFGAGASNGSMPAGHRGAAVGAGEDFDGEDMNIPF